MDCTFRSAWSYYSGMQKPVGKLLKSVTKEGGGGPDR